MNPGNGLICSLLILLASPPLTASATVRRVPTQYSTIQAAVNAATSGDTVLVAPGTYLENVYVHKRVALLSEAGPQVTTIDGQSLAPTVRVEWNVDHASVEGFRITGGYDQSIYSGAGIDVELVSPSQGGFATIRNNIVEYNLAYFGASGINAEKHAIVTDNIVRHNNLTPANSSASAMRVSGVIERNTIHHNGITGDFTTVWLNGTTTFARNTITGGVASTILLIENGGFIHHNTVADNFAQYTVTVGRNGLTEFKNNLVAHGPARGLGCVDVTGTLDIQCNDIWGTGVSFAGQCAGAAGVDGNFSADPLFCGTNDFRLQSASPCLPDNSPVGCGLIGALESCDILAVTDPSHAPSLTRLEVSPNPSSGQVVFSLPGVTTPRALEIFDAQGRQIDVLRPMAGKITWNPSPNLTRGIYFARMTSGTAEVIKFVLLR